MGDFISNKFVEKCNVNVEPLKEELSVKVASGNTQSIDGVALQVDLNIDRYKDNVNLDVTKLEDYDVILGKPWLTRLNPKIDWRKNIVKLRYKKKYIKLRASSFNEKEF